MKNIKKLNKKAIVLYQQFGHFDEHLVSFYSLAFGDPYICEDTYLMYYDRFSQILYLSLFTLKDEGDKFRCIVSAQEQFRPEKMVITSPEQLQMRIEGFHCVNTSFDRDYQIYLPRFDEGLRGKLYKDLRYRVHNAIKRGYSLEIGRTMTHAHLHIIACHESERKYAWWDNQLYLGIKDYMKNYEAPLLFNVVSKNMLIGFDLVDFLQDTMTVPLGFYLEYPSLADFVLFKEIVYAKERGHMWLDLGWACSSGVESFKKKWMAEPRFNIWTYEYLKNTLESPFENHVPDVHSVT